MRPIWGVERAACLLVIGAAATSCREETGPGIVLSPPPAFSIPGAPATADLQPCDSIALPQPLGFLADGRAVVGQRVAGSSLIRAWDAGTNDLQNLFAAGTGGPVGGSLGVSRDGNRIFDIPDRLVYDLGRGQVTAISLTPSSVEIAAISDDGNFVLDTNLQRYTAGGVPDLNFRPLLQQVGVGTTWVPSLSPAGDAVALATFDAGTHAPIVAALFQDGRAVALAGAPDCSADQCGLSWSEDERYVLLYAHAGLRLWDVESAGILVQIDADFSWAGFEPDAPRIVTAGVQGVVERDLAGAATFSWSVDGSRPVAVGTGGKVLGSEIGQGALVVAGRAGVEGRWRQPWQSWSGALALTNDAAFAIVSDWESSPSDLQAPLMLARFAANKAGTSAVFRPLEHQQEWQGQVLLSPDEQRVAVVFPDSIGVFDTATLTPLVRILSGAGMIAWSPDGRYLAATPDFHFRDLGRPSFTPAEAITVWDSLSGKVAASFATPLYPERIAFDVDGSKLVGWGYPGYEVEMPDPTSPFPIMQFSLGGDPAAFEIDTATGTASTSDVGLFWASTRDLVATESTIFRLSTGRSQSPLPLPALAGGVFSGDFSLFLGIADSAPLRLFGVADGHVVAAYLDANTTGVAALALSRDGGRAGANYGIYCLTQPPHP